MKVSLLLLLLLILGIPRERLRPAAWLISVEFRIPTWQHFVARYL